MQPRPVAPLYSALCEYRKLFNTAHGNIRPSSDRFSLQTPSAPDKPVLLEVRRTLFP